jgi:hypothetical protein
MTNEKAMAVEFAIRHSEFVICHLQKLVDSRFAGHSSSG